MFRRVHAFVSVLVLIAGCGSHAVSPCKSLEECCAMLSGTGAAACTQYASATDDATCTSALQSLQAASYCTAVAKGPDTSQSATCDQYLACLLVTSPTAYPGAVAIYGQKSPCWDNATQASGCEQACTASYADISAQCSCTGSTCTLCDPPPSGAYAVTGSLTCASQAVLQILGFSINSSAGNMLGGFLEYSTLLSGGEEASSLVGPSTCNAGTLTTDPSAPDSGSCSFSVTITTVGTTLQAQISATCQDVGACSGMVTLTPQQS